MKKVFLAAIFMAVGLMGHLHAQELTVKSMSAMPMDLSASQYERKDLNGQPCALVKVQLATMGAQFEGYVIQPVEYKTGEYWVYMTEGSYMLNVKHPNFVPLSVNFRDYGIKGVQGKTTYRLTLLMPQMGAVNVDDGMRYLVMTVEPANATVYIDNNLQTLQNGSLNMLLPMGNHSYRVEAQAYETKSGTFTIGNEKLSLPVKLQSNMATLSVSTTTAGTQIYVNDQLRGTSSWSGTFPAGTYRVEGRLQGYRSHRQNVTLAQRDNQQVRIPALEAIVGNLNVNYQPTNAEVWIDNRKAGTSPDVFRNLMVGSHTVELRADGYAPKQERITIEEGKTAMLSGALERRQTAQVQPSSSSSSVSSGQVETITVKGVCFKMVRVSGGSFQMGATAEQGSDAASAEKPVHQVTLSTYYIGETEVTQGLWQAVMGQTPTSDGEKWSSDYGLGANYPAYYVSWADCQAFIQKLNTLTGRKFRLPTEAEWEFAARGGNRSRGYKYAGSNTIGDVAWYDSNSNSKTHAVGTKSPNELGLYDMSGNVWEWCQDWNNNYSSDSQTNPVGPASGSYRVLRGGSWLSLTRYCRVSNRNGGDPSYRGSYGGLRLAF